MSSEELPGVHLPEPSFWPIVIAVGMTLIAAGVLTSLVVSLLGALILVGSIVGWAMENRSSEEGMEHHA